MALSDAHRSAHTQPLPSLTLLPLEIIHSIVTTAATQDRYSALSLALVSHATLSWVRDILWRTIVIRRGSQLVRLLDVLAACSIPPQWRGPPHNPDLAPSVEDIETRDRLAREVCGIAWDLSKSLSLPATSGLPARSVFIELDEDDDIESIVEAWHIEHRQAAQRALEKRNQQIQDDAFSQGASEVETRCLKILVDLDPRRILQAFNFLELLHLGSAELQYLGRSGDDILGGQPREMSIVYTGDDEVMKRVLLPSQTPMTWEGEEGTEFGFVGVRSRLERLHIVGIDPRAGLAGVSLPPWAECLRRGSTSQGSFIHSLATHLPMDSAKTVMKQRSTGIEYLRFDTRRFSFKPPEIVALCLRPYFQELCVARPLVAEVELTNGTAGSGSQLSSSQAVRRPQYSYSGPRHAAPARGAGNRASLAHGGIGDQSAVPLHHDGSDEASFLRQLGAGGFRQLHLAWDTRSGPRPEDVPWFKRVRYSEGDGDGGASSGTGPGAKVDGAVSLDAASQQGEVVEASPLRPDPSGARTAIGGRIQTQSTALGSGGWPAERRDTWTERSERELISSFAAEFADAVQVLYGWEGYDVRGGQAVTSGSAKQDEAVKTGVALFSRAVAGQGEMIDKIERGWDEATRFLLDCIAQGMTCSVRGRRAKEAREKGGVGKEEGDGAEEGGLDASVPVRPEEEPVQRPRYAVRAPASVLKLGGHAAFEREERLRIFEDRASGGKGAWS